MNKNNLRKLSLICLIIGTILFVITYFMFHYLTDTGFTLTFQSEAGKPFVTDVIGHFATLFIFSSILSFICSIVFFNRD
jgi:hypothetical protein